MSIRKNIVLILAVITLCGGCTNTRYLTDPTSIKRQHSMRNNRTGGNMGDVGLNVASFFAAIFLNMPIETYSRDRNFKRISITNQTTDTLYVNMVTDILWKKSGYCDIMGIVLPPKARQKLLLPFPAAYNVYFRTGTSEEEKLEIRTDNRHRRIDLKTGMTHFHLENGKGRE